MNEQSRTQVSATISPNLFKELEEISIRTGLSRSRLFDMALAKFAAWCQLVDEITIRRLSADMAPQLGYTRRDSGFRRSTTPVPDTVTKVDPYHVPASTPAPASPRPDLKKAGSAAKK